MCRHAEFVVPPEPRSAPAARDFVRACLELWSLEELASDVLTVASELITNGVLHAHTPLHVYLSSADGHVEIAVLDQNSRCRLCDQSVRNFSAT